MARLATVLRTLVKPLVAVVALGAMILVMAILAGWFHEKVESSPPDEIAQQLGGELGEVQLLRLPKFETAVGTVQPVHEAALAAKLLARVTEVNVRAGQTVTEGEVLVRLDDQDLTSRVQQAGATVSSIQAELDRAVADYRRAQQLRGTNAISQAELDQLEAVVKSGQANLERAKGAVDEARVILDYATIRSPLTGVIVDKRVEPGDTVTPGQVLVTLYEPERMQILATVRESLASRLRVGDQIPAKLETLEHQCQATVSEIVPQSDTASRSFTVKVTGPCPPGVYSGMFGRISIPLGDEQVVVVPAAAVQRVGQLTFVSVVVDGKTQRRSVRLGRQLEEGHEVLAGLKPGEQVVLLVSDSAESSP
jgi:membrane fusion protein (multidrug efflux system)